MGRGVRNLEKCLWFLSISHFLILWTTDCYWTLTFRKISGDFCFFSRWPGLSAKGKNLRAGHTLLVGSTNLKKDFLLSNWSHLVWSQLEVKCRLAIFLHFSPNLENIFLLKCFRNILLSDNIINSAVKVTGDPHIRKRGISSQKIYVFSTY